MLRESSSQANRMKKIKVNYLEVSLYPWNTACSRANLPSTVIRLKVCTGKISIIKTLQTHLMTRSRLYGWRKVIKKIIAHGYLSSCSRETVKRPAYSGIIWKTRNKVTIIPEKLSWAQRYFLWILHLGNIFFYNSMKDPAVITLEYMVMEWITMSS